LVGLTQSAVSYKSAVEFAPREFSVPGKWARR
jgi:hypothetical protein